MTKNNRSNNTNGQNNRNVWANKKKEKEDEEAKDLFSQKIHHQNWKDKLQSKNNNCIQIQRNVCFLFISQHFIMSSYFVYQKINDIN